MAEKTRSPRQRTVGALKALGQDTALRIGGLDLLPYWRAIAEAIADVTCMNLSHLTEDKDPGECEPCRMEVMGAAGKKSAVVQGPEEERED